MHIKIQYLIKRINYRILVERVREEKANPCVDEEYGVEI